MSDLSQILANLSPAKRALLARRLKETGEPPAPLPAITRRQNTRELPPLSYEQQRLWLIAQLDPDSPAYNIPAALRLRGNFDAEALARSFDEVVCRHESLRTGFTLSGGRPVQVIVPAPCGGHLRISDLRHLSSSGREQELLRLAQEETRLPFDLSRPPLVRARLLRLADDEWVLLLTVHHIVSDGWSMGVLVHEMAALYQAFSRGEPSPLAELPVQYADYAVWQREHLQGEVVERQLDYWKRQLGGTLPALQLPTDRPRPTVQSHRGATLRFQIEPELAADLKALSRREGVTLFMSLLAALKVLLRHYAPQDRIAVGCPTANRQRVETQGLIGFFLNMVIFCTNLSDEITFRELLHRVRRVCLDAYAHQDVPFDRVVEALQPGRSSNGAPLFQVAYTLQNAGEELSVEGLTFTPLDVTNETSQFDLVLNLLDSKHGLGGALEYDTDLFDAATAAGMASHYEAILRRVVTKPDAPLAVIEAALMAADNRRQAVREQAYENARLQKFIKAKRKAVEAD